MTGWIDIGALEDIPAQGARLVRTAMGCVAVLVRPDRYVAAAVLSGGGGVPEGA